MTTPSRWPQGRQYREAVQAPGVSFSDARLRKAAIHGNGGIPLAMAGRSAIVFKATADAREIAIRCFTRAAADQRERYRALQAHLGPSLPPYLVRFAYRDREIRVGPERYPLVEMDWVEGKPLDAWVRQHLGRGSHLEDQAAAWLAMAGDMLDRELAHGDIANDNCLVSGSQLKLIDYDGCFIPGLANKSPGESGAQHFQHPYRSGYYGGNMDAFPSLVVFLSLLALQEDSTLWNQFHKDRNLIFRDADFKAPGKSDIWTALSSSGDDRIRLLTAALAVMCQSPVETLPSLREVTAQAGIQVTAESPWQLITGQADGERWWEQEGLTKVRPLRPRPERKTQVRPTANDGFQVPEPETDAPPTSGGRSYAWVEDHLLDRPRSTHRSGDGVKPVAAESTPQPTVEAKPQPTPARPTFTPSAPTPSAPTQPVPRRTAPAPVSKPRVPPATRPLSRPAPRPVSRRPVKRHPVRTTLLVILLLLIALVVIGVLATQ